ncbi:MAG: YdcH family protein [Deltaproteobacteria bacterium]|nr:YdcH family protein [Deltaproteobacteria bacterium]
MDRTVEGHDAGGKDTAALLEELRDEHARLKARLTELENHVSLTAEEQVERVRLKKLKLHTKDRIAAVTADLRKGR